MPRGQLDTYLPLPFALPSSVNPKPPFYPGGLLTAYRFARRFDFANRNDIKLLDYFEPGLKEQRIEDTLGLSTVSRYLLEL
jgi:hypothetical protein